MDYYKFEFQTATENVEMITALLGEQPFEAFQDTENGFEAFLPVSKYQEGLEDNIQKLDQLFDFSFSKTLIKYQNWNAIWESNFQPILVDNFCGIRADFHDPLQNVEHEIIINPKMAFGTGHHATTWMMIQMMRELDFRGKSVFDFGCGTGILAILASKMGSKFIDALDNELPSYENTLENSRINKIENIQAIHGVLDDYMRLMDVNVILANINRHVILDSLSTLNTMLDSGGKLLISGILIEDKELVHNAATAEGFKIEKTIQRNNWICSLLTI